MRVNFSFYHTVRFHAAHVKHLLLHALKIGNNPNFFHYIISYFREKKSKSDKPEKSEKRDRKSKEDKKSPEMHESDVNENEIEVIEVIEVKKVKPPKRKVSSEDGHDESKFATDDVRDLIKDLLKDLVDNVINSKGKIEYLE